MNRIFFTKKHIFFSAGIVLTLLLVILVGWFLAIAPKISQLSVTNERFTKLSEEVKSIGTEFTDLNNKPTLIKSEIVNEAPIISNGLELESYFKEIEAISQDSSISIKNIKFENLQVFPEVPNAEKQLRKSVVGFDITGNSSQEIIRFVDQLEQGERFVNIQNVIYRASEMTSANGDYAYAATIVADLYYLSQYETGKSIEPLLVEEALRLEEEKQ
ncbi:hypothetical protein ACWOFR_17710 [Carnobacterium gallinarum]|uniref:hypothetical protein n=1 Tax=Carnobacterium gallinarum TaxID=2749 RepID=UPI000550E0E4|nr:hypothetical protein [Carnobacterium gallinarum]